MTETVSQQFSSKMGVTMLLFWIILSISVLGSNAAGEFSVLHSPESLKFSGSSKTLESLLKEIYSASLGLSVAENSEWDGLFITDPFNTPEAVVEVYIDGISTLDEASGLKSKKYPLDVDEYEPDAYEIIKHRIKQRFINGGNKLVNLRLYDPNGLTAASKVFGTIIPPKITKQSQKFKYESIDEDYQFLYEIEVLNELTHKIKSGAVFADNKVDFYYIRFRSLHALSDFHGPNSVLTKEAKKLLAQALQALSDAFIHAYGGSVLVTAVTTDIQHTRRVRAAPELREDTEKLQHLEARETTESPPTTARKTTESPTTTARKTTESPTTTARETTESPPTTARKTTESATTTARETTESPTTTAKETTESSPTTGQSSESPAALEEGVSDNPQPTVKANTGSPPTTRNDNYTADYAAIFNIMLWSAIVFVFSLVAIVYSIMDMDPGRDSIIYRMTSTRLKKDN